MNKKELQYIAFAGIFALVWFTLIIPYIVKTFDGNIMQFFLFNVGLIIFLQIFLKAIVLESKITGSLGLVSLFIALDILTPPYAVSVQGELLTGMMLYSSASDYFMGTLAINLGLSGFFIYLFTYIFAPIILLIISAKLIPNFVKQI